MEPPHYKDTKLRHGGVTFLSFMLFLFATSPSLSQTVTGFDVPRVESRPTIDGQVDPTEWSQASRVLLDIETSPGENIPSAVTAEAFLMEDGETLFVAFIAPDPDPSQIRAFYRDRDDITSDDRVGVILDTFNDQRRAFQFQVNPLGVQYDAIYDDVNDREDSSWNAIWDSAGIIGDSGYSVEMAIPLKQLRFELLEGKQSWGFGLVRQYPRDRPYRINNTAIDLNGNCFLCNFQKAEGFANIEPSMNLEIIPTVTGISSEKRDPTTGDWRREIEESEASLDIRWGITQDIYLNATINPDFSQVEADSAQLDINNTFSLFFPERRTFFLDGADYFNSYENLVHTRNIASPDYGLKLTGKSGDHSYGILGANDEFTSFIIPGSLRSNVASLGEFDSDVSIGRYRYDVGNSSSIGALVTDRQGDDYHNTVSSIDGVFQLSNQDTLYAQSMHSTSEYPQLIQGRYGQESNLSDDAHILEYTHFDRRWDWRAQYFDYGEDFRADLGFVNRVDYKKVVTTVGHTWRWSDDNFFSRIRFAADYDRTEDQSGLQLEEETEFFINMNGPLQSFYNGLFGGSETYWNGKYFDEQFNQVSIGFSPTPNLQLSTLIRIEDIVDFSNTQLGRSNRYRPRIRYQWGRHLQLDLSHTLQKFDVDGGRLFTANLTDGRATYQFNNRSFLRLTLQYADNERNPALYQKVVLERSKELTTQLLYSYKLNAATRFFIGYSDEGFQNDNINSFEKTSRTFFVKFSYAWLS
jgi:hypothetical protein